MTDDEYMEMSPAEFQRYTMARQTEDHLRDELYWTNKYLEVYRSGWVTNYRDRLVEELNRR